MARALEFDNGKAIDKATRIFWRKGYSGASLRDLLKGMGIGEGSFHYTLKSRKQLYLECLKHYDDIVGRRRSTALFSPASAKEGVRGLFRTELDGLDDPRTPRVCLISRCVSSELLAESDLRKLVKSELATLVGALTKRLQSTKDKGELPREFEQEAAARLVAESSSSTTSRRRSLRRCPRRDARSFRRHLEGRERGMVEFSRGG